MAQPVSGAAVGFSALAVLVGSALVWSATWLQPLVAADAAGRGGRDGEAMAQYALAESRLRQVPVATWMPNPLSSVQSNQVRLLYRQQRYDEAIEKAAASIASHGSHFWAACALFARAAAEEQPVARLEWFERAEGEFRSALVLAPHDWDTKFNFELTRSLLNRLKEEPKTPRRQLFELLRPEQPRPGGQAPPRRTG